MQIEKTNTSKLKFFSVRRPGRGWKIVKIVQGQLIILAGAGVEVGAGEKKQTGSICVSDPYSLNPDPDPAKNLNPDPEGPWIRIQTIS